MSTIPRFKGGNGSDENRRTKIEISSGRDAHQLHERSTFSAGVPEGGTSLRGRSSPNETDGFEQGLKYNGSFPFTALAKEPMYIDFSCLWSPQAVIRICPACAE
jgi:hypothetical protein